MRIVLGVVAGMVIAVLCVFGIEMVGHLVYPPPSGIDPSDPADLEGLMAAVPIGALAFVIAAWLVGSLLGAWAANAIGRRAVAGWIVALLIIAGGVWTMATIPHPAWMWAAGILLPLLAAWLAQRFARIPF